MWGQIGDKKKGQLWRGMGKPNPLRWSLKNHVRPAQHMIYCIYSHTIPLNNVIMTDAWEQSWKLSIYSNDNELTFSTQEMKNAFQSLRIEETVNKIKEVSPGFFL